jgi:pre-rRNA-processing protein TSR3
MQAYQPTIIWRHRRENLKKCTLSGLESRSDCIFLTYPQSELPPLPNYCLLSLEAPPLSRGDEDKGLFILDATWRYAARMLQQIEERPGLIFRSLPSEFRTAYPRRQNDCVDPDRGLASIEALYIAYRILGRETETLLNHYHWKEPFLEKNRDLFANL